MQQNEIVICLSKSDVIHQNDQTRNDEKMTITADHHDLIVEAKECSYLPLALINLLVSISGKPPILMIIVANAQNDD